MLRLQVLLLLNREVKNIEEEAADCRERLQGCKDQLQEADRSVTQFKVSIVFVKNSGASYIRSERCKRWLFFTGPP